MKSLVNQLKGLDVQKLRLKSGRTLEQELQHHAEILRDCIERRLEMDIYNARSPKVYDRTYDLLNSIEVNVTPQLVNVDGKKCLSVKVFFNDKSISYLFKSAQALNTQNLYRLTNPFKRFLNFIIS